MGFIDFVIANKVALLGAALGVSEALALIPALKANGILQGIISFLKKSKG